MHKISNFTAHGWESMRPSTFGISRPHHDVAGRRPQLPPTSLPSANVDSTANLSFNVPFSSTLIGPEVDDVLHSSPGAFQKWTFPVGIDEATTPIHKLPVHSSNVENLRKLCMHISDQSGGRIEAVVTSSEPKATQALQRRPHGLVTNVCVSGDSDLVPKIRQKILNETPILLVSPTSSASELQLMACLTAFFHRRH
jgi:hypothetical protein